MRLKSLELVGFKSFVDRTNINFVDGVTGIVGPNGCGKSNVVDAIRWVMGEQSAKHLRGSNMGDVIFNGTETRPAMGMASVFLTFDNADGRAPAEYADYSEITVGRRLYRSGESEYYINKAPCRLKDIVDLFLGTGVGTKAYAIVEQGMIGQIITAKPEDRRHMIEEAAGISKFKARKDAALRKMESTKTNLARIADILTELTRQINSLYRQAKKAERFTRYTDELKGLEMTVSAHNYEQFKNDIDNLKNRLSQIKETEVAGGSRLSGEEADIESTRVQLNGLEIEIDDLQEKIYERQNEIQLLEADVSYKTRDVDTLTAQMQRWYAEIGELTQKMTHSREELLAANNEKVSADLKTLAADEELGSIDGVLDELRDRHHQLVEALEDSRRNLFECVEKVSAMQSHFDQAKRREGEIGGWITKDQTEIDNIDDQIKEIEEKVSSRSGDVTGTKQLRLTLEEESGAAEETLKKQKEEMTTVQEKVERLKEELSQKRSRLHSLEELNRNYEGYQEGVRAVLKHREEAEQLEGVVGTINEIVETEPEYESAVGAVLGEKLQYVVVKSHEVGVEAIDYLKTAVSGRSTFVPVGLRAESSTDTVEEEGVIGPLKNYVRYSDDYHKIVDYLFQDVVLVEDLNKALNIWKQGGSNQTFVTLGGEVVDPAGAVTGGAGGNTSEQLMVHRREIKELTESVSHLNSELQVEEQMLHKLKDRVKGLETNIEKLEHEAHHEEIKLVNQEKDLHHLERELTYYRAQRDKLTLEVASLAEEQSAVKREWEHSETEYTEASERKKRLEDDVRAHQTEEAELRNRLQDMIQKRTELNIQVKTEREKAEAFDREIARHIQAIAESMGGIAFRELEIVQAKETIRANQFSVDCKGKALTFHIATIDELKSKHVELKTRYDQDLMAVREREASIRDLRKAHDHQMKEMHEIELDYTQKQEKLNYMCREIFDRYRVDLASAYREYLATEEMDLETSSQRVDELKEKVSKIGSVNVDAIHEYEELKVRHDFLQSQHDDLTRSLEDLQKAIHKINRTSRVRFQEAFDSVNERFQKLFPKLFEGGKARLVLTDEQNILESGVDIIAQPPGKKLQSITLLSGGEKALTAVALIFSIFLHHPSPFCLLDEVDAPLDDANIDRFNEMIREMTKLSQFILITHNKRTMELADTLYGVTMEERGTSRVISIALTDKKHEGEAAA